MRIHSFAAVLVPLASVLAQAVDPSALPPAGSPEALALFDHACERMVQHQSGTFRTDEEQDSAIMRGQNHLPMGHDAPTVRGGWQDELLWGDTGDDQFAMHRGRMVTKTDGSWQLRGKQLGSGASAPFLLQPRLLFDVLHRLPAASKKIVHVEAGEVGEKPTTVLSLMLTGEAAESLALSGALPAAASMMFSIGGLGGGAPEKGYTVDLALFVDTTNGDVLRLRARVFEDNPMLANVRFQIASSGGGEDEPAEADADAAKSEAGGDGDKMAFKKGLPDRKPGKTESVSYLKADFKDLDAAKPPAIDAKGKHWLGLE